MSEPARIPAVLAYVPVLGWLYIFLFQRQNPLAVFHLRQSVGLIAFLIAVLVVWGVIAWLLAWLPLAAALSVALFTLVILAYFYGFLVWVLGIINALNNRATPLPGFGKWANRLPIR